VQQLSQQSDSTKELSIMPLQVVANQALGVFNPETCEATLSNKSLSLTPGHRGAASNRARISVNSSTESN